MDYLVYSQFSAFCNTFIYDPLVLFLLSMKKETYYSLNKYLKLEFRKVNTYKCKTMYYLSTNYFFKGNCILRVLIEDFRNFER